MTRPPESAVESAAGLPTLEEEQPAILTLSELRLSLQAKAPVCRIRTPAGDEGWIVTRHAEVKSLLQDDRLARTHADPENAPRYIRNPMLDMLITSADPQAERESHEAKRVLYTKSFAARKVLDHRSRVDAIAEQRIDAILDKGRPADLHADFSMPYSQQALCDMIGIPPGDREELLARMDGAREVDRGDESAPAGPGPGQDASGDDDEMAALFGYAARIGARKRSEPTDDVISRFIESGLSDDEIGLHTVTLLFTGLAGVASHIDFGTLLLATNPEQRAAAMDDPEIMARAVDEVLRATVGSPVLPRYAHEDIEIGGETIRIGDLVLLDFSLANFDPRVFDRPGEFDVTRTPNPHFTFGHGMRHCTGAPLVRILLQSAYTTLFDRLPGLRLAVPESELRPHPGGRLAGGLAELPITW